MDRVALVELQGYLREKHPHFLSLPPRAPQSPHSIQHARLGVLRADTLVHALLRVTRISTLTVPVYSYRGQSLRKVVLSVEQGDGQQGALALWGGATAWLLRIQRKRGESVVKAHITALQFRGGTSHNAQLLMDGDTPLQRIVGLVADDITFVGCGRCETELGVDGNRIYWLCYPCLPHTGVKRYYRPAVMTVTDEDSVISVEVPPVLVEQIFLDSSRTAQQASSPLLSALLLSGGVGDVPLPPLSPS